MPGRTTAKSMVYQCSPGENLGPVERIGWYGMLPRVTGPLREPSSIPLFTNGWVQQPSGRQPPAQRVQSERHRDELLPAAGSVAPGRRSKRPSQTPEVLANYLVNTL